MLVFTGNGGSMIQGFMRDLELYLDTVSKLTSCKAVRWLTVITGSGCSPYEALGRKPLGDAFFDPDNVAHDKLDVDIHRGAVVVLRPDGLVGATGDISGGWICEYFSSILYL
jgi:phenol 2-monooxygenase